MSVLTPLGDTLDGFLEGLLASRSAVRRWTRFATDNVYVKVGGDLGDYDIAAAFKRQTLPEEVHKRMRRIIGRVPWSTQLSALMATSAFSDAGLFAHAPDPERVAVVVAGHNINSHFTYTNIEGFLKEPEFIEPLHGINGIDTHQPSCVSEVLDAHGLVCTVGGACASGNLGLREAAHTLLLGEADVVVVVGAVFDWSPVDFQSLAVMGAITSQSFNDAPTRASRPFDVRREGFVPTHGGAVMVLERRSDAVARGARIWAELLSVVASADATRTSLPSTEHQARLLRRALHQAKVSPGDVQFVSAHATSTPAGDVSEIEAIKECFGSHAAALKVNAPKSLLGHACWSAALVESVAAVLQMHKGVLHQSVNIDELDPRIDLDVCRNGPVKTSVHTFVKNAFGFGGINTVSVFREP